MPRAIGSSAFCGLPIAVSASVTFFVLESINVSESVAGGEHLTNNENNGIESLIYGPAFTGILIGVVLFAPIGAKLAHQINVKLLKNIFIIMLLAVALKLLIQ